MPVEFDIVVPNPRLIRSAYTHAKVYRSATISGAYAEVTTPTTRVPLTASAVVHTYTDPTGSDSNYYRIAYWNQRTNDESAQGSPVQGQTDPALDVISVEELKVNYLTGVNLTTDDGIPYQESLFRWYIRAAVQELSHRLDMPITEETITAERHDFYHQEFGKFQFTILNRFPVVEVTEVRMMIPGQNVVARTYPADWVQLEAASGRIEIVPGLGTMSIPYFGGVGTLLPSIYGGHSRSVPSLLEVDYVAGFPRGEVPADLRHMVGMMAAQGPLNIAGDLIAGAGIANYSISLDGLSQSVGTTSSATNAGYGSRIVQYRKEISALLPILRATYKGIQARVG